jgi:predicted HTH domain antitoxin
MGALTGGLADDESILEVAVELYEKEGERDLIEVALELFGPPV